MIRRATLDDAPHIARVHVQAWNETYRGKVPDEAIDRMTYETRVGQWQRGLQREDAWTFVHEVDGTIDAFASACANADEAGFGALLSTLYVLRSAQRQSVGQRLLALVAFELMRREIGGMWLLTLRDENPARAFYERMGARLLREQPAPAILGEGVMDVVYGFPDVRLLLEMS